MLTIKALHIIFMVAWFSGLFYIVRLFVYASEAGSKEFSVKSVLSDQYKIMMRRLWYGISWPAMILTCAFGSWMIVLVPEFLAQKWFIVKLVLVAGLLGYHLWCHFTYLRFQRDENHFGSNFFRVMNEVATLFLVAIVFVVVQKSATNWLKGVAGLLIFAMVLMLAIKLYKRYREKG